MKILWCNNKCSAEENNNKTHIVILKGNLFPLKHLENFTTYLTFAVCTYTYYMKGLETLFSAL